MIDKITIIIPTENRHFLLDRSINYYSQFKNIHLIICDSSFDKYIFEKKNIIYLHNPNATFSAKLLFALELVTTKYVVFCADDDFLVEESIYKAQNFLNENTNYVSVQGQYIMFSLDYKIVTFHPLYNNLQYNIEDSLPCNRVVRSMRPYMHQFYSLFRTDVLLQCMKVANKSIYISNVELSVNLVGMLFGKHKTMPIFWMARDANRYSK